MKKSEIINAYVRIRKIDHTIPDEVLDFMYHAALEKLHEEENLEEIHAWRKKREMELKDFKL